MLWPFSGRAGKTDLTCGCGCACTENNGGSDVYDMTVYSQGVDALIEDGGLRRAFERSGLTHSGGGYTVHYTEDTDNYILSIALKSN